MNEQLAARLSELIAVYAAAESYIKFTKDEALCALFFHDLVAAVQAAAPRSAQEREQMKSALCEWKEMNEGGCDWEAACGDAWSFEEGSPESNNVKFCPFCGRRVVMLRSEDGRDE